MKGFKMKGAKITITTEGVFVTTGVRKSGVHVGQIQKTLDPSRCEAIYKALIKAGKKTTDNVIVFSSNHRVFTQTSVASFAAKAALDKPFNITFGNMRTRV